MKLLLLLLPWAQPLAAGALQLLPALLLPALPEYSFLSKALSLLLLLCLNLRCLRAAAVLVSAVAAALALLAARRIAAGRLG